MLDRPCPVGRLSPQPSSACRPANIECEEGGDWNDRSRHRIGKKRITWNWLGRDSQLRVRRFTLGQWPHIGLAEARRLARAMSYEAPRGADPIRDARASCASAKAPQGHTLADLLSLYER
jgi:hypothetical protein